MLRLLHAKTISTSTASLWLCLLFQLEYMYDVLAPFSLGNSVHIKYISQYSIYVVFHVQKPWSRNFIIIDGQNHLFLQFFMLFNTSNALSFICLFILTELRDMLFPATTLVYSRNRVENICNCAAYWICFQNYGLKCLRLLSSSSKCLHFFMVCSVTGM